MLTEFTFFLLTFKLQVCATKYTIPAATECGVFSIIYQIRWLNLLKRNKNPKLINIINNNKLTDNNVNEIRNSLYRPNIKEL